MTAINTIKKYINQCLNWLSPIAVVTIALPRPVVADTLIPPIMLQTMMYQSMLFLPYLYMFDEDEDERRFVSTGFLYIARTRNTGGNEEAEESERGKRREKQRSTDKKETK